MDVENTSPHGHFLQIQTPGEPTSESERRSQSIAKKKANYHLYDHNDPLAMSFLETTKEYT